MSSLLAARLKGSRLSQSEVVTVQSTLKQVLASDPALLKSHRERDESGGHRRQVKTPPRVAFLGPLCLEHSLCPFALSTGISCWAKGWLLESIFSKAVTVMLLYLLGLVVSSIWVFRTHQHLHGTRARPGHSLEPLIKSITKELHLQSSPQVYFLDSNLGVDCSVSRGFRSRLYVTAGFRVFARRSPEFARSMLQHELCHIVNHDTILLSFKGFAATYLGLFILLSVLLPSESLHPFQLLLHSCLAALVIPLSRRREILLMPAHSAPHPTLLLTLPLSAIWPLKHLTFTTLAAKRA